MVPGRTEATLYISAPGDSARFTAVALLSASLLVTFWPKSKKTGCGKTAFPVYGNCESSYQD
jgi:hypothetical protein